MTQSTKTEKAESVTAEVPAFKPIKVVRTFRAPSDYGNQFALEIKAEAYQINGNQHPHFAVTGDIYHKATRTRTGDGTRACGCLHYEALKAWPKIKPIIDLHLSNADDGEPMHAEANGFYWLAGACGGMGEQYHGGSGTDGKDSLTCTRILAEHLRITWPEAQELGLEIQAIYNGSPREDETHMTSNARAKKAFAAFVESQRPRWQREANEGIELLKTLAG